MEKSISTGSGETDLSTVRKMFLFQEKSGRSGSHRPDSISQEKEDFNLSSATRFRESGALAEFFLTSSIVKGWVGTRAVPPPAGKNLPLCANLHDGWRYTCRNFYPNPAHDNHCCATWRTRGFRI
jgi:hypothetical protein